MEEIIKFDYTADQLRQIVAETSTIITVDIDNKQELALVKKNKLALGKIRNSLKEFGKSKRDYFNEMAKKIITREKELVAIVEQEEDRLNVFLEEAKHKQELADRMLILPDRKEQLAQIGDEVQVTDGFILSLGSNEFTEYVNNRKTEYLNAKEAKLNEEKAKIEREKEIRDAQEKSRLEAEERAKKEIELAKEKAELDRQEALRKAEAEKQAIIDENNRKEKERLEAEERAKKEIELAKEKAELDRQEALRKAEAEKQAIIDENNRKEKERLEAEEKIKQEEAEKVRLEKENQEKLEKQKKYQTFLKENNYNENEDYLLNKDDKVILMRKVAEFKK